MLSLPPQTLGLGLRLGCLLPTICHCRLSFLSYTSQKRDEMQGKIYHTFFFITEVVCEA